MLNNLLYLYKIRAGYIDLKLNLQQNIPRIAENISSLKNRFNILKNNINKGLEIGNLWK